MSTKCSTSGGVTGQPTFPSGPTDVISSYPSPSRTAIQGIPPGPASRGKDNDTKILAQLFDCQVHFVNRWIGNDGFSLPAGLVGVNHAVKIQTDRAVLRCQPGLLQNFFRCPLQREDPIDRFMPFDPFLVSPWFVVVNPRVELARVVPTR